MRYLRLLVIGLLVVSSFNLASCSVFMAAHGKEDIDLSSITTGQDRSIVLLRSGQPFRTVLDETGRSDTYTAVRGNAPSVGRAIGHVALNLATLGLWEIAGTFIESSAGDGFTLIIKYGVDDKLKSVSTAPGRSGLDSLM